MSSFDFLSSLNIMTLLIPLIIAGIALAWFMRKRSNRHPLDGHKERNVSRDIDAGKQAPDESPRSH